MRCWAVGASLLAGCFADGPPSVDSTDPHGSTAMDSSSAATGTASSEEASSIATAAAGTQGSDGSDGSGPGTSSADAESTVGDAESSTTEPPTPTWCDDQPASVVLCHDFDGALPFLGANLWQDNGTVELGDDESVSPPNAMRVEVLPSVSESSNASMIQYIDDAALPFDGEVAIRVWVDDACLQGAGADIERLLLALQFFDDNAPDGPFLLNITLWVTNSYVRLYESDQGQGFPPAAPHELAGGFPSGIWVDVALAFAADDSGATLTIDGTPYEMELAVVNDAVMDEIAALVPAIAVGTAMSPGQPGCTMYFDDVTVSVP